MSEGYFKIIKPLIEDELEIPVLGYFPERKELGIESRHLGLVMPDEMRDIREKLREASEQLERTVSVDLILEIARGGKELDEGEDGEKTALIDLVLVILDGSTRDRGDILPDIE